jgi:hypothetical protein
MCQRKALLRPCWAAATRLHYSCSCRQQQTRPESAPACVTSESFENFAQIQKVQAYLSPPIFVVYFAGILWKRANAKGAMCTLALGYSLGFARLGLEITYTSWCAEPEGHGGLAALPSLYICSNYLYFGLISLACCMATMVYGSLSSTPPEAHQVDSLTYFSCIAQIRAAEATRGAAASSAEDAASEGVGGDRGDDEPLPPDTLELGVVRSSRELPLTAVEAGTTRAEASATRAAQAAAAAAGGAAQSEAGGGSVAAGGVRVGCWQRYFDALNQWGSVTLIVALAVLLVKFA